LEIIDAFRGEYRFLSNFWPCYVNFGDLVYPSTEHAYQSAKVEDPVIKARIRDCSTPAQAKEYLGIHNIQPGPTWDINKKLEVMEQLQMIKFGGSQPLLTRVLLATGDALLVEGNTWNDTFWGVCNNNGENNLGKILMQVRTDLFKKKEHIMILMGLKKENKLVAQELKISERMLYEMMISFSIPNKEYWIS
jgi:ribA/ribD-fused uncharacterized protein